MTTLLQSQTFKLHVGKCNRRIVQIERLSHRLIIDEQLELSVIGRLGQSKMKAFNVTRDFHREPQRSVFGGALPEQMGILAPSP